MVYFREVISSFCLLSFLAFTHSLVAQGASDSSMTPMTVTSPKALIGHKDVRYRETTRTFRKAKFEGLRKRYKAIDGIVMVGVTNNKGEVLLKGPKRWSPPGGAVKKSEDWAAAARRIIKEQTGLKIKLEAPLLVEHMTFHKKESEDTRFSAYILHFHATPADESGSLNKRSAGNKSPPAFKWFNKVPEHAHPNHVSHIELYLN